MRKIEIGPEPEELRQFKRQHPKQHAYTDLDANTRRAIRQSCLTEQFFLCAYCCQTIDLDTSHNDHLKARHTAPNQQLNCKNIVASCQTPNQCGKQRNHQDLPITPLSSQCESQLRFHINGRVSGQNEAAKTTIQRLNLGDHERHNLKLIQKRKRLVQALLFQQGLSSDLGLEDRELLALLQQDLQQHKKGKLQAFAPVLVNILKHWLAKPA